MLQVVKLSQQFSDENKIDSHNQTHLHARVSQIVYKTAVKNVCKHKETEKTETFNVCFYPHRIYTHTLHTYTILVQCWLNKMCTLVQRVPAPDCRAQLHSGIFVALRIWWPWGRSLQIWLPAVAHLRLQCNIGFIQSYFVPPSVAQSLYICLPIIFCS